MITAPKELLPSPPAHDHPGLCPPAVPRQTWCLEKCSSGPQCLAVPPFYPQATAQATQGPSHLLLARGSPTSHESHSIPSSPHLAAPRALPAFRALPCVHAVTRPSLCFHYAPPPQFPRSALMPPHFLLGLAHPLCPSSSSSQLPGKERSPGLWHPSCQPIPHSAAHWWHLPG